MHRNNRNEDADCRVLLALVLASLAGGGCRSFSRDELIEIAGTDASATPDRSFSGDGGCTVLSSADADVRGCPSFRDASTDVSPCFHECPFCATDGSLSDEHHSDSSPSDAEECSASSDAGQDTADHGNGDAGASTEAGCMDGACDRPCTGPYRLKCSGVQIEICLPAPRGDTN